MRPPRSAGPTIGVGLALLALLAAACAVAYPESATPAAPSHVPTAAPTAAGASTPAPSARPAESPTPQLRDVLTRLEMPPRDCIALARAYALGGAPVPTVVPTAPPEPGATERFWVIDVDGRPARQVTATLRVVTDRVEMWVERGLDVEADALERSAAAFEGAIRPTIGRLFGVPRDDGGRLAVLNAAIGGVSGYYSSANEHPRAVNPYSNERRMFVMNAAELRPGTRAYEAVLAHEFFHLIHWDRDGNEDAWVNEGLAQLAEDLAGYGRPLGRIARFARAPDVQLTTWAEGSSEGALHYGASYLFFRYAYERLGEGMLRDLVAEPADGMAGLERVLARLGDGLTAAGLFGDWLVANALGEDEGPDGRLGYDDLTVGAARSVVDRYPAALADSVSQYAADYYELVPASEAPLAIRFRGQTATPLLPTEPTSGRHVWWSNRGDAGHSYLERRFDLRGVEEATLSFSLWYDLEPGWDYAYVRASADGGATWEPLRGEHMVDHNPNGNALAAGYTGRSGAGGPDEGTGDALPAWVRESLDLGAYTGGVVLVRFDCVTDDAVNHAGLALDDLEIEALGWRDDVEEGDGGWRASGFLRHDNAVEQGYLVRLVELGERPRVRNLAVGEDGRGEWVVEGFGAGVERALLVVSAVAPATTQPAAYELALEHLAEAGP